MSSSDSEHSEHSDVSMGEGGLPETEFHGPNQELTIKVLEEGTGYATPKKGDEVRVHYTGRLLDGTKFDSSLDRGDPFKFQLGMGSVIKGWDEAFLNMRKGEKALLTIKPEWAYGEAGSPPKIPPNSTLEFEVELIDWENKDDLSVEKDLSAIKTEVAAGKGWEKPKDKWVVQFHVTARDSSGNDFGTTQGGEPVEATIGATDELPRGVAVLLPTMKLGEVSQVVCKGDYVGRDWEGAGVIPADYEDPVTYEVELVHMMEVKTCKPGLVKKVLQKATGYSTVHEGRQVTVHYEIRTPDGTVVESTFDGEPRSFAAGTCTVLDALDVGVLEMKVGERAEFTASPEWLYDPETRDSPLPTDVEYLTLVVEILEQVEGKNTWDMDVAEKVAVAEARKAEGNSLFKRGEYERAIKKYDKVIKLFENVTDLGDHADTVNGLVLTSHLNTAACGLKQKAYDVVNKHCNSALDIDSHNVKALFRRASSRFAKGDYEDASEDIDYGLEIDPDNADLQRLKVRVAKAEAADRKRQASLYSKMFG